MTKKLNDTQIEALKAIYDKQQGNSQQRRGDHHSSVYSLKHRELITMNPEYSKHILDGGSYPYPPEYIVTEMGLYVLRNIGYIVDEKVEPCPNCGKPSRMIETTMRGKSVQRWWHVNEKGSCIVDVKGFFNAGWQAQGQRIVDFRCLSHETPFTRIAYTCDVCGKRAFGAWTGDDVFTCDDCRRKGLRYCDNCGEVRARDDGEWVNNDQNWFCNDCIETLTDEPVCQECGGSGEVESQVDVDRFVTIPCPNCNSGEREYTARPVGSVYGKLQSRSYPSESELKFNELWDDWQGRKLFMPALDFEANCHYLAYHCEVRG